MFSLCKGKCPQKLILFKSDRAGRLLAVPLTRTCLKSFLLNADMIDMALKDIKGIGDLSYYPVLIIFHNPAISQKFIQHL